MAKRQPPASARHRDAVAVALKVSNAASGLPCELAAVTPAALKRFVQQIVTPEESAAWAEANKLFKPVKDGQARSAGRPSKPANSNDPLIVFIAIWGDYPGLLSRTLTQERLDKIDGWLREPTTRAMMSPALRAREWTIDALEQAIKRARRKPELKRLIRELRRSK